MKAKTKQSLNSCCVVCWSQCSPVYYPGCKSWQEGWTGEPSTDTRPLSALPLLCSPLHVMPRAGGPVFVASHGRNVYPAHHHKGCGVHQLDPVHCPVASVLEFLQECISAFYAPLGKIFKETPFGNIIPSWHSEDEACG